MNGRTSVDGESTTRAARLSDAQADADRLIRDLEADLDPTEAVYIVAVLAGRAATELHRLARAQATETKGTPDWGSWAGLQNAARKLVLDASSARDAAAKLSGRTR
jgi:hypothetical protein